MEKTTMVSVAIANNERDQLHVMAKQLGVTVEDLVRMSITMFVSQPQQDFAHAVDYVLKKNAELYRRLA